MAKRTGRQRDQLPTCYFEGYLEKRSFKDKTSRKLWTCLCGSTLFFFNDHRDSGYVEKLDLSGFVSITDDSSQDRNLDAARLNLQLKSGNIKFTAPNAEARELWKGYIHSVAELSVPTSLALLPGQIYMLKEAVEEEKQRIKSAPTSSNPDSKPYISPKGDMPVCYHNVTRLEAELLLEREAKKGNLLLRPGKDGNSYAVTTRQDLNGPVFKHYRVACKHEGGFAIDVDNPVPCATLHDVVKYLLENTDGVLIPLILEGTYERRISFIMSDRESGEKSIQQAQTKPVPPSLPPKPVTRAQRVPRAAVIEENVYLNVDVEEETIEEPFEAPQPPPKPAIPAPSLQKWSSTLTTPSTKDPKVKILPNTPGQMPLAALSELKVKLGQKARTVE